ncbi:MAG: hypothetical protein B6U76_00930 [Desulfurococcales archaeon ex4484_217_2]|nr:MAG: hypothetical protein B6U76_00930 [Desulfurococcales archaeon ex4484_217_2]
MSCTKAQVVVLIGYLERKVDEILRNLNVSENIRREVAEFFEDVRVRFEEFGFAEIERELGL